MSDLALLQTLYSGRGPFRKVTLPECPPQRTDGGVTGVSVAQEVEV